MPAIELRPKNPPQRTERFTLLNRRSVTTAANQSKARRRCDRLPPERHVRGDSATETIHRIYFNGISYQSHLHGQNGPWANGLDVGNEARLKASSPARSTVTARLRRLRLFHAAAPNNIEPAAWSRNTRERVSTRLNSDIDSLPPIPLRPQSDRAVEADVVALDAYPSRRRTDRYPSRHPSCPPTQRKQFCNATAVGGSW